MSVIVKGMEMPINCAMCERWSICECLKEYKDYESVLCAVDDGDLVRADECPLVEIPTPHGRLGDLDALKAQYKYGEADSEDEKVWMMNIRRAIANAPTVIEAEGETDGR